MVTKAELHQLVDELPDELADEAARRLAELEDAAAPHTPLDQALPDDERLSPEDQFAIAEAREELARGEGLTTAQVWAALGL